MELDGIKTVLLAYINISCSLCLRLESAMCSLHSVEAGYGRVTLADHAARQVVLLHLLSHLWVANKSFRSANQVTCDYDQVTYEGGKATSGQEAVACLKTCLRRV